MADPLASYIRPNFPKKSVDGSTYRTTIEYVGEYESLFSGSPKINDEWGGYVGIVKAVDIEPIENTDYGILTVSVEAQFTLDEGGDGAGTERETDYELEWVEVQRPLPEHPLFAEGGTYELNNTDRVYLERWKNETDANLKEDFYFKADESGRWSAESGVDVFRLSTNARMCAQGYLLGIEYWTDYAPVVRMNTNYAGGKGPKGSAGQKQDPPDAADAPTGYEWVRSADRSTKAGKQGDSRRTIEWTGAKKVLIDKDEIFWSAPE